MWLCGIMAMWLCGYYVHLRESPPPLNIPTLTPFHISLELSWVLVDICLIDTESIWEYFGPILVRFDYCPRSKTLTNKPQSVLAKRANMNKVQGVMPKKHCEISGLIFNTGRRKGKPKKQEHMARRSQMMGRINKYKEGAFNSPKVGCRETNRNT